jgi:hypothetical protein
VKPKPRVPLWRWATWWFFLGVALIVFYGLLTPVWMSLRAAGWLANRRARWQRRRDAVPESV